MPHPDARVSLPLRVGGTRGALAGVEYCLLLRSHLVPARLSDDFPSPFADGIDMTEAFTQTSSLAYHAPVVLRLA